MCNALSAAGRAVLHDYRAAAPRISMAMHAACRLLMYRLKVPGCQLGQSWRWRRLRQAHRLQESRAGLLHVPSWNFDNAMMRTLGRAARAPF